MQTLWSRLATSRPGTCWSARCTRACASTLPSSACCSRHALCSRSLCPNQLQRAASEPGAPACSRECASRHPRPSRCSRAACCTAGTHAFITACAVWHRRCPEILAYLGPRAAPWVTLFSKQLCMSYMHADIPAPATLEAAAFMRGLIHSHTCPCAERAEAELQARMRGAHPRAHAALQAVIRDGPPPQPPHDRTGRSATDGSHAAAGAHDAAVACSAGGVAVLHPPLSRVRTAAAPFTCPRHLPVPHACCT